MFSGRFVGTDAKRPRWRFTGSYAATPRLQIGLEFNPAAGEVGPIANWVALTETERWPMVTLGTSSDRIFSPPGTQSVYATAARSLSNSAAVYGGVSYGGFEKRPVFPWGVNLRLTERLDGMAMHDGRNTHLMLTQNMGDHNVTLLWVKTRYLGVSIGRSF